MDLNQYLENMNTTTRIILIQKSSREVKALFLKVITQED